MRYFLLWVFTEAFFLLEAYLVYLTITTIYFFIQKMASILCSLAIFTGILSTSSLLAGILPTPYMICPRYVMFKYEISITSTIHDPPPPLPLLENPVSASGLNLSFLLGIVSRLKLEPMTLPNLKLSLCNSCF